MRSLNVHVAIIGRLFLLKGLKYWKYHGYLINTQDWLIIFQTNHWIMPPIDVLPVERDNAVQRLREKLLPLLDNDQVKADQYARKTEQMVFDSCETRTQWGHVLAHKLRGLQEKLQEKYAAQQQQQQQQQQHSSIHPKAPVLHPVHQPTQQIATYSELPLIPRPDTAFSLQQQQQQQFIREETAKVQTWARTYMWKQTFFLVRLFRAIKDKYPGKFTQFIALKQLELAKFFISTSPENFWSKLGRTGNTEKQLATLEKMKILFQRIQYEGGKAMERRREQQSIKMQQAFKPEREGPHRTLPPSTVIAEGYADSGTPAAAAAAATAAINGIGKKRNEGGDQGYPAGGFMSLLMEDDLEEGDVSEAILQQVVVDDTRTEGGGEDMLLKKIIMKDDGGDDYTNGGPSKEDDDILVGNQQEMGLAIDMIDEPAPLNNTTTATATTTAAGIEKHDVKSLLEMFYVCIMEEEEKKKKMHHTDDMEEVQEKRPRNGNGQDFREQVLAECERLMAELSSSSLIRIKVLEVDGTVDSSSVVVLAEAYIGGVEDVEYRRQLRMRVEGSGTIAKMVAVPIFSLPSSPSMALGGGRVGRGNVSLDAAVKESFREQYYAYIEKEGGLVGLEALVKLWLGV